MNRRNLLTLLPTAALTPLSAKPKNIPQFIPDTAVVSIPAEEAMRLLRKMANATLWQDRVRWECALAGITDPEEIEDAMNSYQNDLDDLIYAEEDLQALAIEARELLGRNSDNETIDVEATIIAT